MIQHHNIDPVWDEQSRILILGSFPSVKSRETAFFYGHPQNRFWRVLAAVYDCPVPQEIENKRKFLLKNHIAVWDVAASCTIEGSADSSIRAVVPNDVGSILRAAPIERIYVNGKTAAALYRKYLEPTLGRKAECLPSTSPANAALSADDLIRIWSRIREPF